MSGTKDSGAELRPRGWPSTAEYNEAVQDLPRNVNDLELRAGRLALTPLGMPALWSGGFADVYRVDCPSTGNAWAVKCFTRGAAGLHQRYQAISQRLDELRLPFMVDFRFLPDGIRTARGVFPIVKMRWIEGRNLNQFVAESLDQPAMLDQLFGLWVKLAARLHEAGIAHADLQHGNVLLVPLSDRGHVALKLIDYDGMFVPALAGQLSGESGLAAYQHPWRQQQGIYSAAVDRFSHLVICTAVRSLKVGGRSLWDRFNNGENLLFRESDFTAPAESALLRELWTFRQSDVRALAGRLALACQRPPHETPLLSDLVEGGRVRALTSDEQHAAAALLSSRAVPLVPATTPPPIPSLPLPPVMASPAAPPSVTVPPPRAKAALPIARPLGAPIRQIDIVDAEVVPVAPAAPPMPVFHAAAPANQPAGAPADNPWAAPTAFSLPHQAQNPFAFQAGATASRPTYAYARNKVAGPAIGLIIFAILGMGLQALSVMANVLARQDRTGASNDDGLVVAIVAGGLASVIGAVILLGGLKMKALRSHSLATSAAVLAMLPCLSPCCIIGLPLGAWALSVLNDANVKSAFR